MIYLKIKEYKSIILPLSFVPDMKAMELLNEFIENNKGVAVVVDEFGGTGMITIEDILKKLLVKSWMNMIMKK